MNSKPVASPVSFSVQEEFMKSLANLLRVQPKAWEVNGGSERHFQLTFHARDALASRVPLAETPGRNCAFAESVTT